MLVKNALLLAAGSVLLSCSGCMTPVHGTRAEYVIADERGELVAEADVIPRWVDQQRLVFYYELHNRCDRPLRVEASLRMTGREELVFGPGKFGRDEQDVPPGERSWCYLEFAMPATLAPHQLISRDIELELRAIPADAELLASTKTFFLSLVPSGGSGHAGIGYVNYSHSGSSGGSAGGGVKNTVRPASMPKPR